MKRFIARTTVAILLTFGIALLVMGSINSVAEAQNTSTARINVDKAWSCTTAGVSKTLGFNAVSVSVTNDGSVTAYIDFINTSATTDDYPLLAGETYYFSTTINYTKFVSCITSSSTTTLRFLAVR